MANRVTMQDIADATGYSRNTVSKALNNSPAVPESTKSVILSKAVEMKYKMYAGVPARNEEKHTGAIALLAHGMPSGSYFGSEFISSFTERIGQSGYTLTMYIVKEDDVKNKRLPANFDIASSDGILCIELFDPEYSQFLCTLGLPTLFADAFVHDSFDDLPSDMIMMDNHNCTQILTKKIISGGGRTIGFAGDKDHCLSFNQRFEGYLSALSGAGIAFNAGVCILADDSYPYNSSSWFREQLDRMERLPDGFVCANDSIAVHLVAALKGMGLSIPTDIMVVGFDDAPESKVLEPSLSTVAIPGKEMGIIGANMMLARLEIPNLPYQTTYVETHIVLRNSIINFR